MDDEFVKQLTGSGAANLATAVVFFLIWVVKNKCKHSRCKGHSFCCDLEINDESSTEGEHQRERRDQNIEICVRKEAPPNMQELHRRVDKGVSGSH